VRLARVTMRHSMHQTWGPRLEVRLVENIMKIYMNHDGLGRSFSEWNGEQLHVFTPHQHLNRLRLLRNSV
jgi:hypothetical protein